MINRRVHKTEFGEEEDQTEPQDWKERKTVRNKERKTVRNKETEIRTVLVPDHLHEQAVRLNECGLLRVNESVGFLLLFLLRERVKKKHEKEREKNDQEP